ncbi:MAG: hypothetical protein Q9162_000769 [Coniocarpon cinnabarinum]
MADSGDSIGEDDADGVRIDFCTLGMFIIDEIHFQPPKEPVFDILGGAGPYAALGARLLSPESLSGSIGWIVDAGSDFPTELRQIIASWRTSCLIRETPERLTTRAWNGYGSNERRSFRYTTPKLRLDHESLSDNLLLSRSFHIISSPARCKNEIQGILERRAKASSTPPVFLWEPAPDTCVPEELANCLDTLKHVQVVSPNHAELCSFFGKEGNLNSGEVDRAAIEQCSANWVQSGIGPDGKGFLIVRAGATGCYLASKDTCSWMPAYHQSSSKVVDPTGGGNTFLGGVAACLARVKSPADIKALHEAAAWGSVAASYAIEQVGMPALTSSGAHETWNGSRPLERLAEFKRRLSTG